MVTKIEYKTEGKALITCPQHNAKPVRIEWALDGMTARLYQAVPGNESNHIELSKEQLKTLARAAFTVAEDLSPRSVPAEVS